MSDDLIEKFDPRILRRAAADETEEELFWTFERYQGAFETHYSGFSDVLLVGHYAYQETDSPDFLSVGKNSLMRRKICPEFGKDPTKARRSMGKPFRDFVKSGHLLAHHTGQPVFEIISTLVVTRHNRVRCDYRRLILPVHTRTGKKLLLTYCGEFKS